jgi:hypothetical protein
MMPVTLGAVVDGAASTLAPEESMDLVKKMTPPPIPIISVARTLVIGPDRMTIL